MRNWFHRVRREFFHVAKQFAGKPIIYCEIGCWTGDSAEFVCERILMHPESRGIGIDPYLPDWRRAQNVIDQVKADAVARLAKFPNWSWIFEKSQDALRTWDRGSIDLLYVDGSHNAHDVVMDFCFAWPHLQLGSVILFDDYSIGHRQTEKDGMPRVPQAVDAIQLAFSLFLRRIEGMGRQAAFEVMEKPVTGDLIYNAAAAKFALERVR